MGKTSNGVAIGVAVVTVSVGPKSLGDLKDLNI